MIIVCFGALGAVVATLVGEQGQAIGSFLSWIFNRSFLNWQVAYIVGGILGLMLLVVRMGSLESSMFHQMHQNDGIKRGDLKLIFTKNKT